MDYLQRISRDNDYSDYEQLHNFPIGTMILFCSDCRYHLLKCRVEDIFNSDGFTDPIIPGKDLLAVRCIAARHALTTDSICQLCDECMRIIFYCDSTSQTTESYVQSD